jgi:hypothetical protein
VGDTVGGGSGDVYDCGGVGRGIFAGVWAHRGNTRSGIAGKGTITSRGGIVISRGVRVNRCKERAL